jgi:RimJ/RimL family protein N-acetyltransferase
MAARVPAVQTERLALVSLPPWALRALLNGRRPAVEHRLGVRLPVDFARRAEALLRIRLADVERDPAARPWLLRLIVLRGPGLRPAVGLIGFHGRPDDDAGRAEVGYEIFEPYRRRGYAREAVVGLLDWAARRHGVRRFLAAIGPDNEASLRLALGLGFRQVGVQVDEDDGLEFVYEVDWPAGGFSPGRGRSANP